MVTDLANTLLLWFVAALLLMTTVASAMHMILEQTGRDRHRRLSRLEYADAHVPAAVQWRKVRCYQSNAYARGNVGSHG